MNLLFLSALSLVGHDVEHHVVGVAHSIGTYARKVMDAAVNIVVNDAFGTAYTLAFHGEKGGEDCGAYTRRDFQCAAWLGTVAYHSGEICYHVFYGIADALVVTAHEIGDAAAAAYGGYDTSAEGGQLAEALLYVNGGEMAKGECTDKFFLGVLVFLGIDGNRIGGADALGCRCRCCS